VSFFPSIRVRTISRLDASNWNSPEEVREFRESDAQIVRLMNRNMLTPEWALDTDYCTRGLESRSTSGLRKKHRNRQDAYYAVFEEQEDQKIDKISDPEFLADIYGSLSSRAKQQARHLALEDEHYVKTTIRTDMFIEENTFVATSSVVVSKKSIEVTSSSSSMPPIGSPANHDPRHRKVAGRAA